MVKHNYSPDLRVQFWLLRTLRFCEEPLLIILLSTEVCWILVFTGAGGLKLDLDLPPVFSLF